MNNMQTFLVLVWLKTLLA